MERLDDLIIGGLKIYQDTESFCFSMDAVLLAHFVPIKAQCSYGELGSGTGAVSLLCCARGAQKIVAFEISETLCALAKKSISLNGLNSYITVVQGDYRIAHRHYGGQFQGIFVNPPYFRIGKGKISSTLQRATALHEWETSFLDVAKSAKRLLNFGGYLWMIYRSDQLIYALDTLRQQQLEPKRVRFIHSDERKPSKLFLLEAKYGGKEGLKVEAPLYIYDKDGSYSDEVNRWYER